MLIDSTLQGNNQDNRLKRLACKDVIEYVLEHKTVEEFEKRLEAIEQKLDQHK